MKQYFATVYSKAKIPNLDALSQDHKEKLNNYLKYGISLTDEKMEALREGIKPVQFGGTVTTFKKRDVHHMSTTSFMEDNGQTYGIVTVLCCEDEAGETQGEY
jgi:hypothetical protein